MSPSADVSEYLPLKPVEFFVLAVVSRRPLHGYGISQEILELTGGRVTVRAGDLYRVIYRLTERGLIESVPGDDAGDERRINYRATPRGRRVAAAEAELMSSVARAVSRRNT